MRVISLTSIPPRFAQLGETLDSLVAQGADKVVLALPERYRRFPGPVEIPPLPSGVTLLRPARDDGPATKLLPALRAYPDARIAYCDDDCIYAPGWLDALIAAWRSGIAIAASGWSVTRLRRRGADAPQIDIAQGFAGVLVDASMFDAEIHKVPRAAWTVDDIWISGQLARRGVPILPAPAARALCRTRPMPGPALQSGDRARANRDAAAWLHDRYGIWPPMDQR